jgi:hypothetical protein
MHSLSDRDVAASSDVDARSGAFHKTLAANFLAALFHFDPRMADGYHARCIRLHFGK